MDYGDGVGFEIIGYSTTTTFTEEGLTPGEDYYFLVVAENIVGQGPDSLATKIIAGKEPN
jgi:hypothetical protein